MNSSPLGRVGYVVYGGLWVNTGKDEYTRLIGKGVLQALC